VIVIQQVEPGKYFWIVEIDADRCVGVSNTEDGALYARFVNGQGVQNIAFSREAGMALIAALEAALEVRP
jgi:hypothetical protein